MNKHNIKNKIGFTQNFLRSSEVVKNLLVKTTINSNDTVYEIGAGTGVITSVLAQFCKRVVAIELDDNLYNNLKNKLQYLSNVEIRYGDFLSEPLPVYSYKVFSNLPFMITSDIIKKLINSDNPPIDMYIIVQKEFAEKLLGTPKETLFSLIVKPWFGINIIHSFKPSDFYPIPKVDIVLLGIHKKSTPSVNNQYKIIFKNFVAYSFTHSGPTLQKSLKDIFDREQFQQIANTLRFNQKLRPSEMTFEQWLGLFKFFLEIEDKKQQRILGSNARLENEQTNLRKIHRTRTDKNWKKLK